MKRVLFIGHDASRSGAPLVLLYFLRRLKKSLPPFKIDLLLLRGGELENEYREIADEFFIFPENDSPQILARGFRFLKKKLGLEKIFPKSAPFDRKYDVVFGNTAVSLEYLKHFKEKKSRTVCWLHELEYAVKISCGGRFAELAHYADYFIATSKAVENMLRGFGIEKNIQTAYGFIETETKQSVSSVEIEKLKTALGIPKNAFVIGGSGTIEWRKGVDLFLQIAARTANKKDIYFLWVGGKSPHSGVEYEQIQHDLARLETGGKVVFTGRVKNPQSYFSAMDLFALTSREDPFPLVCLEAASFGKPIICFEKAGGMPEFVEDDAGAVVSYGDTEAFADKIFYFYENRNELKKRGAAAREKLLSKFSAEISYRKIEAVLHEASVNGK
jgi:Glycosyltransferase